MRAGVGLLVSDVMPMYMIISLNIIITMCFSINCPTIICLPIVCFLLEREASSETYGPQVYFLSYNLSIYFYLHLYFSNLYYKIPKIFILSYYLYQISLSQVALKGLTTPLLRWLRVLVCLCRCVGLLRSLLLD